MSVRVIDRVWRSGRYSGGTLLVLLAMADWASDDGSRVFPTTRQLATKSRMTERQVRSCVRTLETDGVVILVRAATGRPGQANEYRIVLKQLQAVEDDASDDATAGGDGGRIFTPEKDDTDGGSLEHGGRKFATETAEVCDRHIDKPSRQPSTDPSSEPPAPSAPMLVDDGLPDWLPREAWAGYVEMRRKNRHPLTERAQQLEISKLEKLRSDGEDPEAVLDQSTTKCWRGLFPVKKENGNGTGRQNPGNGSRAHQAGRDGWNEILRGEGERQPDRPGELDLGRTPGMRE